MNKIGYVLSGGGARGFAHLGVIKFLEETGIKPNAISGTSAGAIVGALYATGKGPEEILQLFKKNNLFGWSSFNWMKEGVFSMDVLRKLLKETIVKDNFDSLKIKLFVATTDLNEGKSLIFCEGKMIDAVVASASVPVVFEPVRTDNLILVDGGILNNFPVEPLINTCDIIIGSYVNKVDNVWDHNFSHKTINILDRCIHLAIANSSYSKMKNCDVFVDVPLHEFDMYDIKPADKIFEMGYKTASLHKEKFLELIEKNISAD